MIFPQINTPGSSLIRVETAYNYVPVIGLFGMDSNRNLSINSNIITMRHTAFRRSRLVDPIPRTS